MSLRSHDAIWLDDPGSHEACSGAFDVNSKSDGPHGITDANPAQGHTRVEDGLDASVESGSTGPVLHQVASCHLPHVTAVTVTSLLPFGSASFVSVAADSLSLICQLIVTDVVHWQIHVARPMKTL
jgi:hypothetical protein